MSSFIECFLNLTLALAIVSETWFAAGSRLEREAEALLLGNGLRMTCLNRAPLPSGVAYGGVAIVIRDSIFKSKDYKFDNPERFEVLPLSLTHMNIARKILVIAAYIPPGYSVPRGRACLQHICDLVLDMKNKHPDPLLIIAGDFNQWEVGEALAEFSDMTEVLTPPTRGDRHIDKIFTNWAEDISDSGCLPPLSTIVAEGLGTNSDHNVQYLTARLPRKEPVKWEVFTHRPFSDKGCEMFKEEIRSMDWSEVLNERGSNAMATKLNLALTDLMDKHFPLKTVRRKESDLPWINETARKMIRKKKAVYKAEGPSARWTHLREKLDQYLDNRQQAFLAKQRDKFIGPLANQDFYRNIQAFKSPEKPSTFDVRRLCNGGTDKDAANEVAEYFNRISREFKPLETKQIPFTYHRNIALLTQSDVEKMLRSSKKTKSMVAGDIFTCLVNDCAPQLSIPLTCIYNAIISTHI